jgi:hypothetical protein
MIAYRGRQRRQPRWTEQEIGDALREFLSTASGRLAVAVVAVLLSMLVPLLLGL